MAFFCRSALWQRLFVLPLLHHLLLVATGLQGAGLVNGHADDGTCTPIDAVCQAPKSAGNENDDQCTVYLAPSSIPGAGLGIFTAIDRQEGDIVGYGDVIIPIVDFDYHMSADYKYSALHHVDPTANYVWDGREMGQQYETAFVGRGIYSFAPGMHCGVNCHLGLLNVDKLPPSYDTANLHRSQDPGAGAFTPYHNASSVITHFVPAGGELFENYGSQYFLRRKALNLVPVREDYPQAEQFVALFNKLWDDHLYHLSFQAVRDLWKLIYEFPLRTRLFNALPKNTAELEQVLLGGIRATLQPHFTRDIFFLKEHGRCFDNIRSGLSTIRQAGRGAFAARPLKKGEIVTGSPLLWYPNGDYFRMYDGDWTSQDDTPNIKNQTHSQIMMNYCWTHSDSSLFLCPYGAGVQYINHNKTRANIAVQWAKDGALGHMDERLKQDPKHMFPIPSPGLVLDFVATDDIPKGAELFMDYGTDFENAWHKHVLQFQSSVRSQQEERYVSARTWNVEHANDILLSEGEQVDNPYPDHFQFRCLKEVGTHELTPAQASAMWDVRTVGLPCTIQGRQTSKESGLVTYTVHFLPDRNFESDVSYSGELWWMETTNVPREAIKVVDAPYTTDLFLKTAFRQPIGIPDHIFPDAWRGFRTTGAF